MVSYIPLHHKTNWRYIQYPAYGNHLVHNDRVALSNLLLNSLVHTAAISGV
jgi:hypothetical protein